LLHQLQSCALPAELRRVDKLCGLLFDDGNYIATIMLLSPLFDSNVLLIW
jgi:hypothetical protein